MDYVGNFRLANLAEGEYRLRILSTLDVYKPMDRVVAIVSGIQGILRDTLRLEYKPSAWGIPFVNALGILYDSTCISAILIWNKVDPVIAYSVALPVRFAPRRCRSVVPKLGIGRRGCLFPGPAVCSWRH